MAARKKKPIAELAPAALLEAPLFIAGEPVRHKDGTPGTYRNKPNREYHYVSTDKGLAMWKEGEFEAYL